MIKEFKLLARGLVFSVLLAGCGTQLTDSVEKEIEIGGLAKHYHTGDEVTLTASLDTVSNENRWAWFIREEEGEWQKVVGLTTEVFSREATIDELEVKAALLDNNEKIVLESKTVKVSVDDHHGSDEDTSRIYNGFFYNKEVADRTLKDWEGEWQSVYPYLEKGALDPVFEAKSSKSDTMTFDEYKEYYEVGYVTDIEHISIQNDTVSFTDISGETTTADYIYDGFEILVYEKGNRGVRFTYKKESGDTAMPQYIQFSDHIISPEKSGHYHLYWGDDRMQLLEEVTHWPTFYPAEYGEEEIVRDMLAH
ncbi:MAG TPA: metal-binding protein ZinT [Candidatus Jeotgalibaca merdavium]|uniref:Metal-binding protein ZinT n=1 Tax=Candidatus Jeotgalibaca merdavium TaxID=2838627 RepID=A0A9D2I0V7_9LACT|nr:metal-binding protein ZinT [Candidatus Jeotgalibaca merdavium]